jgi:hypothetical protein
MVKSLVHPNYVLCPESYKTAVKVVHQDARMHFIAAVEFVVVFFFQSSRKTEFLQTPVSDH